MKQLLLEVTKAGSEREVGIQWVYNEFTSDWYPLQEVPGASYTFKG